MIDKIRKMLGKRTGVPPKEEEEVEPRTLHVATCALFLEMAEIDGEFSSAESERILSMLKEEYGLREEYALEIARASSEERKNSLDLWQFTNLINENYSDDEKIRVVELLWKIVYADGKLDEHEDYLVHKLAKLLRLTHRELIDAKLSVLRGPLR